MKNAKRYTMIFRALANINRLKIITLLKRNGNMCVGDIANELSISLKATSNHLAIMKNLDIVESRGAAGHVFYLLNPQTPTDLNQVINFYLK